MPGNSGTGYGSGGGSSSGGGSTPANYDPARLGRTIGSKLEGFVNNPAPVFNQSQYPGMGATTQSALQQILSGSNPGGYSGHITDAIGSFGDMAAGRNLGTNAPGYQQVRGRLADDVMTDVSELFTQSGRFGSGSHVGRATESLADTLGAFDLGEYHRGQDQQFAAAGLLPMLYSASQLPGQTNLAVGQLQDADALATRQGEMDLFDRTKNADYNRLLEVLGAFQGSSNAPGMQEKPDFWQLLLGGLGTAAGIALR